MSLVLCARCERHIRPDERACPFCDTPHVPEVRVLAPFRPTSRAAVLFFTATSLVACGKKEADAPIDAPVAPVSTAAVPPVPTESDVDADAERAALKEKLREAGAEAVAVYGPAPVNSNRKK